MPGQQEECLSGTLTFKVVKREDGYKEFTLSATDAQSMEGLRDLNLLVLNDVDGVYHSVRDFPSNSNPQSRYYKVKLTVPSEKEKSEKRKGHDYPPFCI